MASIDEAIERGVKKAFEKPVEILGGRSFNQLIAEFRMGEIVPVVKCFQCKHWKCFGDAEDGDYDIGTCELYNQGFGAECFCSYGERKEDEHGNRENP